MIHVRVVRGKNIRCAVGTDSNLVAPEIKCAKVDCGVEGLSFENLRKRF